MGWVNIVNNVYINNFQFAGNIYKKIYIQLSKNGQGQIDSAFFVSEEYFL